MAVSKINFFLGRDTVMPPQPSNARGAETVARVGLSTSQVEANGSLNFLPTVPAFPGEADFDSDFDLPRTTVCLAGT